MAELDSSTMNAATVSSSEDPVAEFLAREQSVLGDLEDDLINKVDGEIQSNIAENINDDLFNSDSNEATALNGDIIAEDFVQANGDIANGISDLSLNNSGSKPSSMDGQPTMMSQPIIPAEEPESIKRWREQHLKNLEQKDLEEKAKIEELRQQAKKKLEEWYQRYQEQLAKAKKQNRENSKATEKEWVAERDNEQPGQAWEKISKMCDFNPKTSRNNRDTSRMRSILLQLKQNPPVSSTSSSSSSNNQAS